MTPAVFLLVLLMLVSSGAFFVSRAPRSAAAGGSVVTSSFSVTSSTKLFHTYSSKETAQAAIKASKIVVFSKTACPFCKKAKAAISELTPLFSVIELDVVADGAAQQAALLELTGQSTVPNIFVNGKHIGGCDSTLASIASGDFQKLIAV